MEIIVNKIISGEIKDKTVFIHNCVIKDLTIKDCKTVDIDHNFIDGDIVVDKKTFEKNRANIITKPTKRKS